LLSGEDGSCSLTEALDVGEGLRRGTQAVVLF
jgi:hypothetical protein